MPIKEAGTYSSRAQKLLVAHIEAHWPSMRQFSFAVGIAQLTIGRFINGRSQPDLHNAAKIERATLKHGKPVVRCIDWTEDD